MNKIHLSYLFIIAVLVTLLVLSLNRGCKVEVKEKRVTDTLVITKIDTVIEYKPKYITRKITDTLYLPTQNQSLLTLPIEQKHYKIEGIYDVWVSGYKPQIDSIKTYPKVEYRTITNTITKEVVKKEWNLYTYVGFKRLSNSWQPSVGLMVKSPKYLIMGVEFGAINNEMYYGVNFGFKIK